MDSKKYKSYEFPTIEETFLQEKSISKYEIPQYIQDIPEGFSLFCTLWEASKVKQYMLLSQEEQEKLNIKENYDKIEKDNNVNFNEPIPKNNYCYICQEKFEDYLDHIESLKHKNNFRTQNPYLIKNIKNTFKRINKFWNKNNNNYSSNITEENEDDSLSSLDQESNENDDSEENKENHNENKSEESKEKEVDNSIDKDDVKLSESPLYSCCNESISSIKPANDEDLNDNKENIGENKCEKEFNFNIIDSKRKEEKNFLKKKRITFDVIRCEKYYGGNNEFRTRDYFCFLNKYKTKKLIRNINIFFK